MIRFPPRACVGFLLALCLGALSVGCGGPNIDGVPIYPVSGTVLVQGKPLTSVGQGSVSFHGDAAKGPKTQHIPTGRIDAEENYELVTGGKKGAPAGWYKVLVSAYANKAEEGPVMPRLMLEPKYYDETKTDLRLEVVSSPSPGQYDLNVTKKGKGK